MISKPQGYDHLFQNLIPNSIDGIKIFGVEDQYVKPQDYDAVNNLENRIWAELYQNLEFLVEFKKNFYFFLINTLPVNTY